VKLPKRGTWAIDRRIPGIGRFSVASGTTSAKTYRLLVGMVDALKAAGRLDILTAMHTRVVAPLEVWDAYRVADLDRLPSAETIKVLFPGELTEGALETWRLGLKDGKHKDAIKTSFAQLKKVAPTTATIGDLPAIVAKYRKLCEKREHGRSFNLTRSHCQAFLRDTVGRSHAIYRKIADLSVLPVDRAEGHPLTVQQLDALLASLKPASAAAAHDMAMTGMGPGEYWGKWEDAGDRVRIRGTKRKGRNRVVPLIAPVGKPQLHPRTFANHLQAAGGQWEPYDMRRTFAHIMEEAGIPRTRRRSYLGHSAGDVTDLYEKHEVEAYLRADGAKLRAYLASQRATEAAPKADAASMTVHTTEDA
jgi:integrase